MRSKIITQVTVAICIATVALVAYILFFKVNTKTAYFSISENYTENSHTGVLCDGEYLYDIDYNTGALTNKRLASSSLTLPTLSVLNTEADKEITKSKELPSTYECSQEAISWYINKLISDRYRVVSYTLDSEHIDYTLQSMHNTVRVVWIKDGYCHIFCVDSGKNDTAPPYLIE